jgi:hypothetical protein
MNGDEPKDVDKVGRQGDEEWDRKCLMCEQQWLTLSEQSGAAE